MAPTPSGRSMPRSRPGWRSRHVQALGYEYVHIANWWEPTSRNVMRMSSTGTPRAEFSTILFGDPGRRAAAGAPGDDQQNRSRAWTSACPRLTGFASIIEASHRAGPFTRWPTLRSAPPYAFNPDGSKPTEAERQARTAEEEYVIQLEYTNRRALESSTRSSTWSPASPSRSSSSDR